MAKDEKMEEETMNMRRRKRIMIKGSRDGKIDNIIKTFRGTIMKGKGVECKWMVKIWRMKEK